jgi:hypothetical protein
MGDEMRMSLRDITQQGCEPALCVDDASQFKVRR